MIVTFGEVLAVMDAADSGHLRHAASFRLTIAGAESNVAIGAARLGVPVAYALARLGPSEVIVKRGAGGCVAWYEGRPLSCAARPVRAVGTVGAGDAFAAGYLVERLAGEDFPAALRTAATVGAFAVTQRGDWEGLPRRAELPLLDRAPRTVLR